MKHALLIFILVFFLKPFLSMAQINWPHWRGPNYNGIVEASDLPVTWDNSKNIQWKIRLPSWSAATPITWEKMIFVMSPSSSDEALEQSGRGPTDPGGTDILLLAISKSNGKILWEQKLDGKNELHRKQNDTTPSPVTDGKYIWVVTGTGIVSALDMTGKIIWKRNLQEEYGQFGQNWGYGSSPLLYQGKLYIQVLHGYKTDDPSYILSINGNDGKILWRHERHTDAVKESPDAYTTPLLLNYAGEKQIIISGGNYVTAHELASGKEIWRGGGLNPKNSEYWRMVGSAVASNGLIYVPTRKKPLVVFKAGGKGDITNTHFMWKWDKQGAPDVPSPICDGKYLYMIADNGKITCLEARSGDLIYGPRSFTKGIVSASPILAAGKIYAINENGVTTVLKAGPEFEVLATNELDGSYTLSSPAIAGNQIIIRTATHLYCIGE
jgi:outer membrane protein assembly factor BamB